MAILPKGPWRVHSFAITGNSFSLTVEVNGELHVLTATEGDVIRIDDMPLEVKPAMPHKEARG